MANRFVREFPQHKADIEAQALLGLVRAENHPGCPGPEEYQPFAYAFVAGACSDLAKQLRRQKNRYQQLDEGADDLLPGRPDARGAGVEWADERQGLARLLRGMHRRVFMRTYGAETYRPLKEVADDFELSLDQVKRLHGAVVEALSDLPRFLQVA